MTQLILVRHGETEANVEKIWQGSSDAPLTPLGRKQVEAVARRLAALHRESPIGAFYTSPLPRARRTADAIARWINIEPIPEPGLQEMDIGDWEGRSFRELAEAERLWERWSADPTFAPPNGESPRLFQARVLAAVQKLADAQSGATILIVSHGGVISTLLARWIGNDPREWPRYDVANGALSIIERADDGWQLRCLNDTSHLPQGQTRGNPATESV